MDSKTAMAAPARFQALAGHPDQEISDLAQRIVDGADVAEAPELVAGRFRR